ncbi:MAG: HigA family addiction module antitoxin [Rhodomicrobium sp.]
MSKSPITTDGDAGLLPNPHPGEILLEEFLKRMGLSQNRVARDIHVPPRRIDELVLGKRAVTAGEPRRTDVAALKSSTQSQQLSVLKALGRRISLGWRHREKRPGSHGPAGNR